MAGFPMCADCRAEYEDPGNRRFHAQPTACPECGPRLSLRTPAGDEIASTEPLADFVAQLRAARIGLLKGLGGYHLACRARDEAVVAELRRRKQRDEKPFALMVRDLDAARALCELSAAEEALLDSTARPIVLLRRRVAADVADAVAPGNPMLGIMLPYTPLHHLLMHELGDEPLVLTSGNRSDEPIAYLDDDARARLVDIADVALTHDRPIHVRCDDSVTRVVRGREAPIRRSRGYAPQPVRLPVACPMPILAVGGQFKGAFALGRDQQAFLSHHLGDLDHYEAYRAFEKDIALYERLFATHPALIVHDLHPDYASTRYARARGGRLLAVQHHHAHLASCLAENAMDGPAVGVIFDGTGYGTDGTIWGGEFLIGDARGFDRAGHLRTVGMPGGAQAIREPWRMALAHLLDSGLGADLLAARIPNETLRTVTTMLERKLNTPLTSSIGRLFDAVAAIIGLRERTSFEGQAAIELEWQAWQSDASGHYPFRIEEAGDSSALVVDTRPLIMALAAETHAGIETPTLARRFHATLVEMIVAVCQRLRKATGVDVVALSGGVFMNALLAESAEDRLTKAGFRVLVHRLVPPNDAGLCLGQLAIGAAHLQTLDS